MAPPGVSIGSFELAQPLVEPGDREGDDGHDDEDGEVVDSERFVVYLELSI